MKYQNHAPMNAHTPDPRFRLGGIDGKFDEHQLKRNENDVFKTRIIGNMKTEPPNDNSSHQWANRQRPSEKMACDSTSSTPMKSNNGNFMVPLDPKDYRQAHKLNTPDKIISSMLPAEFLKMSRAGTYSDRPLSTATSLKSGYIDMPGSRNSGSLSRHSARGKKRMLSVSPICSEVLDLTEIIRTSPNSLVAFVNNNDFRSGFISRGSTGRNSSAASHVSHSSYGHLSPAPMSKPMGPRQRNYFATPDSFQQPSNNFFQHPRKIPLSTSVRDVTSSTGDFMTQPPPRPINFYNHQQQQSHHQQPQQQQPHKEQTKEPNNFKTEENMHSPEGTPKSTHNESGGVDSADDEEDAENKEDFRCQWKACGVLFENQSKLVQHLNTEHIQKNKKDCTCYWDKCSREEKPFKAMYMLVVHVRRHTGEKPHKCHYEGCDKAYSRLENLKTHLRSHTGERPYVCEIPGCEKAFSNASDRAKHQNRTHSSVKQYGCKVEGCPKRYTDPSSLRKHMKTVHGATSQPNKKVKVDHNKAVKKEEKVVVKVEEEPDDPPSPNKRKMMAEECSPIKHSPSYYNNFQGGGGGSPSYNPSSGMGGSMYTNGYAAMSGYNRQPTSGGMVSSTSNMDYEIQRTWNNNQGELPANVIGNDPLNLMNDMMQGDGNGPGNVQVQVQIPNRNIQQNLHKPMDPPFANRRLSNNSVINSTHRRESNVSINSVDSCYLSGTETYNSGRRDSNHSTLSYASGGRQSANLPSPLPSRNLSPGRINQTVIEGEVLDNYTNNAHLATQQQQQQQNMQPLNLQEAPLRDVTNIEGSNMFSRVSSGYGSQQTTYFPAKTPNPRLSPTPSREQRRASEGRVIRVSDAGFNFTELNKKQLALRRASDPVKIRSAVDTDLPRRGSFSCYNVLPTPQTMQSISGDIPTSVSNNTLQNQGISPKQQPRFGGGNLMVMPQNINNFDQQMSRGVGEISPVVYAQPDSTNLTNGNDNLAMLMDNYNMQAQQHMTGPMQISPNMAVINRQQQQLLNQQHNTTIASSYQQPITGAPRLSHIQTPAQMTNTNFMNHNFAHSTPSIIPHPPVTPRDTNVQQMNGGQPGNFNFTLQWTNNHFGGAKQKAQQMEADSTNDKDFERLMVDGLASLNTVSEERPKTNMAINRMDSLLTSYTEENKYFEYNTINRYQ